MTQITAAAAPIVRYLRSLDPGLPRPVWLLQAGAAVNTFGTGLVTPFLLIYLHNVRGFGFEVAGLVVASFGAVSLVSTSVGGAFVDRLGARRVAAVCLGLLALGYGLFPLARTPWEAFLLLGVAGLGNGAFWPAQTSLTVAYSPPGKAGTAFAVNRVAGNLGLGLGAAVGGLVASHAGGFTLLFRLDAVSFLLFAALLPFLPALPHVEHAEVRPGRYADVLRDRPFVGVVVLNAVLVLGGFAQLEAGLPAYAKNHLGFGERAIGLLFFLNVAVVVVLQLPVGKHLSGHSRLRALAVMGAGFACAWLLVLAAGAWAGAAAGLLVVAVLVFSLAECLHSPAQGGLVADLAAPDLRGRYFALSTNSYAIGFTFGPALAGLLLGLAPDALWVCAAAACVCAGLLGLVVERRVPAAARIAP